MSGAELLTGYICGVGTVLGSLLLLWHSERKRP